MQYTLTDITESGLFCDGDWIEKKDQDANGTVRLIQLADIGECIFKDKSNRYITEAKAQELKCTFLHRGDILIARLPEPLGRACIFPLSGKYITAVDIAIVRISNTKINTQYLMYLINSSVFRAQIKKYESGTTRKRISRKNLAKITFSLPPLSEQERIVAHIEELFSELDAGVETLKKTKAQLDVYRQAIITEIFKTVYTAKWIRLDQIAEISGGITKGRHLDNGKIISLPYLRVANVQNGFLNLKEIKYIDLKESELSRFLLQEGDVLDTEGGDRDKLGRGTVWHNEIKNCVHQNHVFKARTYPDQAVPQYVSYWSMSQEARNYFYNYGKQSVNLASINKSVLSALKLPLPEKIIQLEIIRAIETNLSVCNNIEQTIDAALEQSKALRHSILKEAFEGKM